VTTEELLALGEYASALFAPGRGPRLTSPEAFDAWADTWAGLGLTFPAAKAALRAWVMGGQHQGAWDPGALVRSLRSASTGDAGDMWALACRWVADFYAGPVYRGGEVRQAPSLDELAKRPDRAAWAAAVRAIGTEAIRNRRPEDEGTLRAQFRKAYEEAASRQVVRASLGLANETQALGPSTDGRLMLPDLTADRRKM